MSTGILLYVLYKIATLLNKCQKAMIYLPLSGRDPNKALFIGNDDNRWFFAKQIEQGHLVVTDGYLFAIPEMNCLVTGAQDLPGFVQFVNTTHRKRLDKYGRLNHGILAKLDEESGLFLELIDDPFGEFVPQPLLEA